MDMFQLKNNIFKTRFHSRVLLVFGWHHTHLSHFELIARVKKKKSTFSSTCRLLHKNSFLSASIVIFYLILLVSKIVFNLVLSYSAIFYTGAVSRDWVYSTAEIIQWSHWMTVEPASTPVIYSILLIIYVYYKFPFSHPYAHHLVKHKSFVWSIIYTVTQ